MAVGMDRALPRQQPTVLRPAPQGPMRYGPTPPSISDGRVQDVVNNQRAASAAIGTGTLRAGDRAGVSRGRGQQYMADIAQQGADIQARSAAAQTEMGAAAQDAATRQSYEQTMNAERAASGGLLEGLRNARAMENISRRGWQEASRQSRRRGQFQLDSMQPDYTPLLYGLFS